VSVLTVDRWADQEGGRRMVTGQSARRATMPARASAAPPGSWRSERDLQQHLHTLQERAAGIESDLADLQRSLGYQLLFDGQRVSGLTRSRLDPAVGAVEDLWLGFTVLGEVLAEAASVVGNGARPDLDQLRNVEWMLFDDSLELGGRHLTPDELLTDLTHALSATAQIIEEADDIWRHTVPALARSEEEIEGLLRRADDLGSSHHAESLRQLRIQVSWLRGQAADDPLGVVEAFERDALPRLRHLRDRLADETGQQQVLASELSRAGVRLAELKTLHARVVEEAGLVWAKIAQPRGLLAPPDPGYLTDHPMGLDPWLARLRSLSRTRPTRQVRKGLASWLEAAAAARARELEVLEANREPLRRRQELRGLLSSLQAKAEALGAASDAGLADIGGRAKAILYSSQTDLDDAAVLVREYGDRLRVLNSKEVSYR
jgi:hypothetical protein